MKLVQYAIAVFSVLVVTACGAEAPGDSKGPGAEKCDAESTFAQVQQQIFEDKGCTASACHGDLAKGGLDLRPDSAYASLINVGANSGDYVRVFPGEQELSLLYQKVAAKTEGFELASLDRPISGGSMPTSDAELSDTDLALLRSWIRSGAPETGIVDGSEEFSTCDLVGDITPNKIQPLPAPAVDEGVQLYGGGWTIPAEGEGEMCFVSYFDYSEKIPADFIVPCTPEYGGEEQDCFVYKSLLLAQDPQSHHSIIDFYIPPEGKENHRDPMDPSWKNWVCNVGPNAGVSCTPGGDECGDRGQCTTEPLSSIACITYRNAPPELGTVGGLFGTADVRQQIVAAQESTFHEEYPEGVYDLAPVKGFVVWDSHAFNPTKVETSVEQWMNFEFAEADERVYARRKIFDAGDIFGMGRIDAFSSKEACTTYTIPQHAELLTLSSHFHRFGKEFRVWYPPNAPCFGDAPDNNCEPSSQAPDYESYDYQDPLYQRFSGQDAPKFDSPDVEDRTFKYCGFWDNGESNPKEVRRESTKPDAESCDFVEIFAPVANQAGLSLFACGCSAEERSCFGGPNQGMACNGDDAVCGEGGICDACPAGGGVTTEEEMFILLGSYYVKTP
jgi:hypothetical protein